MRLVTFLGTDFADAVNDFLSSNASRVTVVEEGEEHSLESYAVFREYLAMVEGKLEAGKRAGGSRRGEPHSTTARAHTHPSTHSCLPPFSLSDWSTHTLADLIAS
jgi:hypothetical protein